MVSWSGVMITLSTKSIGANVWLVYLFLSIFSENNGCADDLYLIKWVNTLIFVYRILAALYFISGTVGYESVLRNKITSHSRKKKKQSNFKMPVIEDALLKLAIDLFGDEDDDCEDALWRVRVGYSIAYITVNFRH